MRTVISASLTPKIRVCVVEDDPGVRESLTALIAGSPNLECPESFSSGEAALKGLPLINPDVVLMDIQLERMTGIECVRKLKSVQPNCSIIMLTAYEDDNLIFQALKAGACGYLIKQTPASDLLDAITEVHGGGAPMSSSIARKVIQSFHQSTGESSPTEKLSPREHEILRLLSKGFLYKEIAESLSISFDTVHGHVRNIYTKLHVRSRTEAVAKYLSH